jgi:glycoprotein endo-alpha-1,2-mannosidase
MRIITPPALVLLLFAAAPASASNQPKKRDDVAEMELHESLEWVGSTITQANIDFANSKAATTHKNQGTATTIKTPSLSTPSRFDIQTFYYPWYANIKTDKYWRHWNAPRLNDNGIPYVPEHNDLPASFFPRLGAYSSTANTTLTNHMKWMKRAGIGVINMSWWGAKSFEDALVWKILDAAQAYGLRVAFYIEPYNGGYFVNASGVASGTRTPYTAQSDVKYLIDTYGSHPAIHRLGGRPVFMFFAAREYLHGLQDEWRIVWDELHADKSYNPVVIAHDTDLTYRVIPGGWDGGHEYGCVGADQRSKAYTSLAAQYKAAGKIFYFSVCPGYEKYRDKSTAVDRENGKLYERLWRRSISAKNTTKSNFPVVISTWNEFHEGAVIEPVQPMRSYNFTEGGFAIPDYKYKDYNGAWGRTGELAEFAYIDKTKEFSTLYLAL